MASTPASLGHYRVQRVLGKGAMGVVYEGLDPRLHRRVAIKTIQKKDFGDWSAHEYSARFLREAQAVARLNHPNIVQVYDFGEDESVSFIVMEFIDGKDLKTLFDENGRFELRNSLRIMCELLDALDFAHQAGVVHRDIKPANVMLDGQSRTKLTDFGVARFTDQDRSRADTTQVGTIVGTPAYMSPEQVLGQKIDGRSDIFSAGVLLYEFLTGKKPFEGGAFTLAKMIIEADPPPPSSLERSISPELDLIISRTMAKNPDHRFATAREAGAAIRLFLRRGAPLEIDDGPTVLGSGAFVADRPPPGPRPEEPSKPPARARQFKPQSSEADLEFWRSIKDSDDHEDLELYVQKFPDGIYVDLARRKIAKLLRTASGHADEDSGLRSGQFDEEYWRSIKDSDDPDDLELYLRKFPEGTFAELARRKLAKLRRGNQDTGGQSSGARRLTDPRSLDSGRSGTLPRPEAEWRARRLAEDEAKADVDWRAEEQARTDAEQAARVEILRQQAESERLREVEVQAKREAEDKARRDAEDYAKREAEARALREAEDAAKREAAAAQAAQELARQRAQLAEQEAELKARREAETKALREASEKARREAEESSRREAAAAQAAQELARQRADLAKQEAELKARREAEAAALQQAAEKSKREAEESAKREASAVLAAKELARQRAELVAQEAALKARRETEERAHREAEGKARREAEERAQRDAEESAKREAAAAQAAEDLARQRTELARQEAELKARREAEAAALRQAAERTRLEAEENAKRAAAAALAAQELERQRAELAKQEADLKARREAENRAAREAEAKAKREAEDRSKREADARAKFEADTRRKAQEIQKPAPRNDDQDELPSIQPARSSRAPWVVAALVAVLGAGAGTTYFVIQRRASLEALQPALVPVQPVAGPTRGESKAATPALPKPDGETPAATAPLQARPEPVAVPSPAPEPPAPTAKADERLKREADRSRREAADRSSREAVNEKARRDAEQQQALDARRAQGERANREAEQRQNAEVARREAEEAARLEGERRKAREELQRMQAELRARNEELTRQKLEAERQKAEADKQKADAERSKPRLVVPPSL